VFFRRHSARILLIGFATPHDEANRTAVAAVPAEELLLAGIAMHAPTKTVERILHRLRPHP
jgi:hypothetical protein